MRLKWLSLSAVFLLSVLGLAPAADPASPKCCPGAESPKAERLQAAERLNPFVRADVPAAPVAKKGRGHKAPSAEVLAKRHADAFARHGHRVKHLPVVAAASFDCRTMGWVLPVNDQGQCGDCFGISSIDACAMAFVKAGRLANAESSRWSGQYGLDCGGFDGGCNGGDEAQVFEYAKTHGFPLTSDYGPYQGGPGRCKNVDSAKLLKITDWGYCANDQGAGIASTDDIKKCMVAYGPISVAFDAGECDSYRWPGTMTGRGRGVDHAVLCIAWDDAHDNGDGTKGAFIGYNQWGDWGNSGAFWIKYGADSWGTEAIFCVAAPLPVPPTPPGPPVPPTPPTPPGPNPPTPPAPGAGYTGTIVVTQTYVNGVKTGEVTSLGATPTGIEADLKAAGVNPTVILDVLKLITDLKTAGTAKSTIMLDIFQILLDLSPPAEPPAPMPKDKVGSSWDYNPKALNWLERVAIRSLAPEHWSLLLKP